jgi:hypothetical protein
MSEDLQSLIEALEISAKAKCSYTLGVMDVEMLVERLGSQAAEIERLRHTLTEIRDLARTGLPPTALNMTEDQWDRHRLSRIAREANAALEKQRGEG